MIISIPKRRYRKLVEEICLRQSKRQLAAPVPCEEESKSAPEGAGFMVAKLLVPVKQMLV